MNRLGIGVIAAARGIPTARPQKRANLGLRSRGGCETCPSTNELSCASREQHQVGGCKDEILSQTFLCQPAEPPKLAITDLRLAVTSALTPSSPLAPAFSVLICESAVSDRLSGVQMHATVDNGVYVILVNDVHGYAEMVKQLSQTISGNGPRRIAKRATLRASTAQEHRQAVACIPGVKAELAARLVSHFGGFGGVVAASEDDLLKVRACASFSDESFLCMRTNNLIDIGLVASLNRQVVGVSRIQAERMVKFFGCRRGHSKYSDNSWKQAAGHGVHGKGPR